MRALRAVALSAALVAVALILASGPGARLGAWDWRVGFTLMKWAMFTGFGAAIASALLLLIPAARRPRPAVLVVALVLGVMAGAPAILARAQAGKLPYIHDITTDTADPPAFVALVPARRAAPNGVAYGGPEVAAQQLKAYPEVVPRLFPDPPQRVFESALAAARAMGWEIVAADAAAGRIEATATTAWFGFKDDVVVRVRPEGSGSRIDVRSASRVGTSDIGANARRVRNYLARLT